MLSAHQGLFARREISGKGNSLRVVACKSLSYSHILANSAKGREEEGECQSIIFYEESFHALNIYIYNVAKSYWLSSPRRRDAVKITPWGIHGISSLCTEFCASRAHSCCVYQHHSPVNAIDVLARIELCVHAACSSALDWAGNVQ